MIGQVRIASINYEILEGSKKVPPPTDMADGHIACGQIDYLDCVIYIEENQHEQAKRVVLWHEILHGILNHTGHIIESEDEDLVIALSHSLVQVLRDNPMLVNYTTQE